MFIVKNNSGVLFFKYAVEESNKDLKSNWKSQNFYIQ